MEIFYGASSMALSVIFFFSLFLMADYDVRG